MRGLIEGHEGGIKKEMRDQDLLIVWAILY